MRMLLGLILASSLLAQTSGSNVVTIQVIPQQNVLLGKTFTSTNLQNIGQSSHILKLTITTTNLWSLTAVIQGSNDGTTYYNIGPVNSTGSLAAVTGYTVTATGSQSYPFIRTLVTVAFSLNNSNFNINGLYIGNSSPSIVQTDLSSIISSTSSFTRDQDLPASAVDMGAAITGARQVLYGFDVFLPATATNFSISCLASGVILYDMPTGAAPLAWVHLQAPVSIRPYGNCDYGDKYTFTSAGTGRIGFTVIQRWE